jgi:hypothetical protein
MLLLTSKDTDPGCEAGAMQWLRVDEIHTPLDGNAFCVPNLQTRLLGKKLDPETLTTVPPCTVPVDGNKRITLGAVKYVKATFTG